MKNKKNIQAQKKEEHKRQMLEAKKRKRSEEPILKRKAPTKPKKAKFLIICEGENTEPSYFNLFKLSNADIEPIGEGYNTLSLVNRAIGIVEEKERQGRKYNQIWCVFDKDDFSNFDFN
ncbi:MAG: RloB family protein, partial [Bacteroidota bacterium]|nr:RloB family protein [Bacteroidota bacterium]